MAVLRKSDVVLPVLPRETVAVPELGGDVIVQGMLLRDRFDLYFETVGSKYARLSKVLALSVVDADGEYLFTQDEWEIFGAQHAAAGTMLFDVARRLSGLDAEIAKKN